MNNVGFIEVTQVRDGRVYRWVDPPYAWCADQLLWEMLELQESGALPFEFAVTEQDEPRRRWLLKRLSNDLTPVLEGE